MKIKTETKIYFIFRFFFENLLKTLKMNQSLAGIVTKINDIQMILFYLSLLVLLTRAQTTQSGESDYAVDSDLASETELSYNRNLLRKLLSQSRPEQLGQLGQNEDIYVNFLNRRALGDDEESEEKALFRNYILKKLNNSKHKSIQMMNNNKRAFQIKTYFDALVQNDGSILLIPKDVNKNHYFIGK